MSRISQNHDSSIREDNPKFGRLDIVNANFPLDNIDQTPILIYHPNGEYLVCDSSQFFHG